LVSSRRWEELRQWSQTKKPPIGYEVLNLEGLANFQPFVVACIEAGKWNEMQLFISKCTTEKDVEKLKELRGRNVKENVAKALDQHFVDLHTKKGKR
jgi:Vps16, C-terminal region